MTVHQNSLANLTKSKPFKAGKEWTGNRLGKPKGTKSRTTLYRELFSLEIGKLKIENLTALSERLGLPKDATVQDLITVQHLALVASNRENISLRAIEMANDNAYGKQTQSTVIQETVINTAELGERIKRLQAMYKSEF